MTRGTASRYPGKELELFAEARNWKRYWASKLRPFIGGRVLDVGAGLGGNLAYLAQGEGIEEWRLLEPDKGMADTLKQTQERGAFPAYCQVTEGTLAALPEEPDYDSLLYIDVLEHIEEDAEEVRQATKRLAPGGRLVVLAPAHQALSSPLDDAVGHHRRYTAKSLAALTPSGLKIEKSFYLDSLGIAASLANRVLFRKSLPSSANIKIWDRFLVPLSRFTDWACGYRIGKTVVVIWRKVG